MKELHTIAEDNDTNAVKLATDLTIAWLSNSNTRAGAEDVLAFLNRMHETVLGLLDSGTPIPPTEAAGETAEHLPAVSVRKSLASRDHIVSMIDGKPCKTLRRHLSRHGLTPDEYRRRYGLKADYPMVAPAYSEARRDMAKTIGLGRKPARASASNAEPAPTPARGGRKRATAQPAQADR